MLRRSPECCFCGSHGYYFISYSPPRAFIISSLRLFTVLHACIPVHILGTFFVSSIFYLYLRSLIILPIHARVR